jgi:hypothetical protein
LKQEEQAKIDYADAIKQYIAYFAEMSKRDKLSAKDNAEAFKLLGNLYSMAYDQVHKILPTRENKKLAEDNTRKILQKIIGVILPFAKSRELAEKAAETSYGYANFYRKFLGLAAYRSAEHFALYIDPVNVANKNHWTNGGMRFMRGTFDTATKIVLDGKTKLLTASCPTGYGKSYSFNCITEWILGVNPYARIIFISESASLIIEAARNVVSILKSREYAEVFPFYQQYSCQENKIFNSLSISKNDVSFVLAHSTNANYSGFTRQGSANGVRGDYIFIDDLTRGAIDAARPYVHEENVRVYDNVWVPRGDGDEAQIIFLGGTCWAEYDLLNVVRKRAEMKSPLIKDKKLPYTHKTQDDKAVFIAVPYLDYDTDESTFPEKYSTERAREMRETMFASGEEALWFARCQQQPIEPKQMYFQWKLLRTYETIPSEGEIYLALLDPPKRGTNNLCLTVWKKVGDDLYLVNGLHRLEDLEKGIDAVIEMVSRYNVREFHYESNSDYTLKLLVKQKLDALGQRGISVIPFYTTDKKDEKIFYARNLIRDRMVFPKHGLYSAKSDMGQIMKYLTEYNPENFKGYSGGAERHNMFDDAPDCCAMSAVRFLDARKDYATLQVIERRRTRSGGYYTPNNGRTQL